MKHKLLAAVLLAFLLAGVSALAADELIPVPKDGTDDTPVKSGANDLFAGSDVPNSKNTEDYVSWAQKKLEAGRKNYMAALAARYPQKANIKCLWHKDAFGFRKINDSEYEVNCFAGSSKNITHVLFYQMRVSYSPSGCDSVEKTREFFKPEHMHNSGAAISYVNFINSSCVLSVQNSDLSKVIRRSTKVTTDWVNTELDKDRYEGLRSFVNTGKSQKRGSSDGFDNPLRETGDDHKKAD